MAHKTTTQILNIRWQDRSWRPRIRRSMAEAKSDFERRTQRDRLVTRQVHEPLDPAKDLRKKTEKSGPACERPKSGWSVRQVLFLWRPRRKK